MSLKDEICVFDFTLIVLTLEYGREQLHGRSSLGFPLVSCHKGYRKGRFFKIRIHEEAVTQISNIPIRVEPSMDTTVTFNIFEPGRI